MQDLLIQHNSGYSFEASLGSLGYEIVVRNKDNSFGVIVLTVADLKKLQEHISQSLQEYSEE